MTQQPERLHRISAVCDRLDIGRTLLEKLFASGELHSVKIGKRRLVPESALADYLERLTSTSA